ncbi:hypothetical protein VspSTUT11_05430 [Vibrio sp. STUT-A11]|nr:hypothetical protein VspSTUT11_05430 [Vibrio sp. STUT-A11]
MLPISDEPDYSSALNVLVEKVRAGEVQCMSLPQLVKSLTCLNCVANNHQNTAGHYNFENRVIKAFISLFTSIIHVRSKNEAFKGK